LSHSCRICGASHSAPSVSAKLLDQCVDYFDCSRCGYFHTQEPTWLDQAYASTINNCDTGIMLRNQTNVGVVLATLTALGARLGRVVDFAGGYGILVRLLRDRGVDALWSDPYCKNLLAIGFKHNDEEASLVTAFEAFEHFVEPIREAEKLFAIAPNLLISTELIPTPAPAPEKWWYYGLDHGQHIGFYRMQTLEWIARKYNKYLISDGRSYHLFSEKKVSVFYWRSVCKLAVYLPIIFTRGMPSRVWSDFEKMSGKAAARL
jgi:hypothetical protein